MLTAQRTRQRAASMYAAAPQCSERIYLQADALHVSSLQCALTSSCHIMLLNLSGIAQGDQDRTELEAMAKRSADGVIHFNPQQFDRYAVGKRRPYSLIFFLTAAHLQDKASLGLRALRKQYGLLAKVCLYILSLFCHAKLPNLLPVISKCSLKSAQPPLECTVAYVYRLARFPQVEDV